MRKSLLRTFAITAVLLLIGAGSALALRLQVANIVVITDGGFTPTTLPKHEFAPITVHGEGRIGTTDGSLPPILKKLTVCSLPKMKQIRNDCTGNQTKRLM